MDQGSGTERSQKMSISSQINSNEKKSSFAPSDQSRVAPSKKSLPLRDRDNSGEDESFIKTKKVKSTIDASSIPNFAYNDTVSKDASNDASKDGSVGKPLDGEPQTSKSLPPYSLTSRRSSVKKFDSVLNIQARIADEDENESAYNPFKARPYRQSKTSEGL